MGEIKDVALRIPPLFVLDYILHNINSSSPIDFIVETTSQLVNYALSNNFLYFGLGQIILLLFKPFGIAAALTVLVLRGPDLDTFYRRYVVRLCLLSFTFYLFDWLLYSLQTKATTSFAPITALLSGKYTTVLLTTMSMIVFLAAHYAIFRYHSLLDESSTPTPDPRGNTERRPSCGVDHHLRFRYALFVVVVPCVLSIYIRHLLPDPAGPGHVPGFAPFLAPSFVAPFLLVQARSYSTWFRNHVTAVGLLPCLRSEWGRMRMGPLLKLYWSMRVALPVFVLSITWITHPSATNRSLDLMAELNGDKMCQPQAVVLLNYLFRDLMTRSCDTTVTLLSTALTLSYLVDKAYRYLDLWLLVPPLPPAKSTMAPPGEEPSLGTASALLFLILAAQTGITGSATVPVKLDRIGRNLVLMSMALLHLLHDTVIRPRLMSLAASGVRSCSRHVRAHLLALSVFSLAAWTFNHYYLSHQLISTTPESSPTPLASSEKPCDRGGGLFNIAPFPPHSTLVNTWLVSVMVLSAELCLKVTVCIITYALRLVDFHRSALIAYHPSPSFPWPGIILKSFLGKDQDDSKWDLRLDQALWYSGSIGGVMEFAFGLVLFFNALWILTFESRNGGAIRAAMTLLHAYFNLWLRAQRCMGSLLRRLRVDRRLTHLTRSPTTTLEKNDPGLDLTCPICRVVIFDNDKQHSTNGPQLTYVVTDCGHSFHVPCLRRWLYAREDCPMCRTPVSPTPSTLIS